MDLMTNYSYYNKVMFALRSLFGSNFRVSKGNTVLIGAGGHAVVLIEALRLMNDVGICGLLDGGFPIGTQVSGYDVLGDDRLLSVLSERGVTHFTVAAGSVEASLVRRRLYDLAVGEGLVPLTVQHPSAIVAASAVVEPGAQLMAGCIIGPEARIGTNAVINSGAIVEHHARVGAHAHIASGACLTGGVCVGEDSFVGARTVVRQGVVIGNRCTIGMGSVVTKDFCDGVRAFGVPARVMA